MSCFPRCFIGVDVYLLVFETTLQSLYEDIVDPAATTVHANKSVVFEQGSNKVRACELAALVRVEYFWRAVLQRLDFFLCHHTLWRGARVQARKDQPEEWHRVQSKNASGEDPDLGQ